MNSGVLARNNNNRHSFISAEQSISEIKPYSLNLSDRDHENLLKISRDADWLLKQQNLFLSGDNLHSFYVKNLYERGLSTFKGRIFQDELLEAFKRHYSPTILKLLQCEINELTKNHWLTALFKKNSRIRHPIRHLLAINFLGYTAEEVLKLSAKLKPFGDGPWPCLNPVCQNFKQSVIKECHLTTYYKRRSYPVGTFECICGFTYSRKGPDASAEDQFRKSKHKKIYGTLWELSLIRLWDDEAISLNQIARRLGVGEMTIKRQAALLKLTFPRVGSEKSTQLTSNLLYYCSNSNPETKKLNLLENHQKKFLEIRQQYPLVSRSRLKEICLGTYDWLQANYPDWLETHLPPPISNKGKKSPSSEVDWEKRDIELAAKVKAAAVHIRSNLPSLVRVTVAQIGRDIGKYHQLHTQLDRLPLTAKVLAEMVETHEEFAVRKIERAAKGFLEENICPTQWQLLRRAKVHSRARPIATQQVKEAIDAALESLASIDAVSDAEKSSINDSRTLHEV
ncbi:TnsD family Tn7-like transposition protein [Coleofasciculus sp. FACHB-1120]|uniref:TnsD family Tn7-like transposition protein n=1 Tax=Coleofasciculus sp. FACHB-1120 TaxID=2692783 RepID=UPI001F550724|nr:TnsD family Tn7-like transposition protein [Coleofasciculus sp. FACHB-1120]